MKCPNCGSNVGQAPFCPQCGADMTSKVRRHRSFVRKLDRRVRHGVSAGIIFVALISVLMVVLSAIPAGTTNEVPEPVGPPEGSLVLPDGGYIVLSGGFDDGTLVAYLDNQGRPVIGLDEGLIDGYGTFRWDFRNDTLGFSWTKTNELGMITWIEPSVGHWTVTVYCTEDPETSDDPKTIVYSGHLMYHGDRTVEYVWEHSGKTLSVTYTVPEPDPSAEVRGDRGSDLLSNAALFVDPNAVANFEYKVWSSYSAAFPGISRTSSDYARCLLELISEYTMEQSDLITYGETTYWATPLQTLYWGAGDSGDIAVLAASMLKSAGYSVGLVKLPDLWSVAIGKVLASTDVVDGYSVLQFDLDGQRMMACDVTPFRGIGMMPDLYGYDDGFTYCGTRVEGDHGAVMCQF